MEKQKLKVLQLGKQYYPHIGGIEVTMQQIAEGIQGTVESYVLASQEKGEAHQEVVNGVPVYYAKSLGVIASLPISFDLVRYMRKHANEYDVIHLHMPFPLGDLACLLSGYKGKLVLYWHSDIIRQKKALFFYKPLMHWTLKRADTIAIATQGNIDGSPYVKPYEKKCVLIPFGLRKNLEEKSRKYWESRKQEISEKSADEKLKLLFVGRLVYYKGCDILMEAMEYIQKHTPAELKRLQLTFVGTGVLEEELKKRTEEHGLTEQIHFAGKVSDEDLEKNLEACDVLAFPSTENSEAFGLVQIEAMTYGKPVLNTSLPTGVPWVSLDGETGLTVPPKDAKSLADAILWMLRNPERRAEMSKKARIRVQEEFSEKQLIEKILGLYQKLCEK